MRRTFWILLLVFAFPLGCSKQGNKNATEIAVVVWSDLTVPTQMSNIHIDVTGPSKNLSAVFPLTAGSEPNKTRLPLQLSLVPSDNRGVEFDITATGYLDDVPVVAQTATLSFLPGERRLLTLHLDGACIGVPCDPGNTCVSGACKPAAVASGSLPVFDPKEPLTLPDASIDSSVDSGSPDDAGVAPDGAAVDTTGEAPQALDGSFDRAVGIPPDAGNSPLLDSGPPDKDALAPDGAAVGVTTDVPQALDGSFDLPVPIPPDAGSTDTGQYTLTLSFAGAGAGTVIIQPGNTTCTAPTTCTATFATGASITVTAKPTNSGATVSSVLSGWTGACAANGPRRVCYLTISGATSTTARFDTLPANLVFVTSGTFPGDLGSALAYQSRCNSLAAEAGINNATNDAYIAWLAATNYAPVTLLGSTRGWVRADLLPWIDDMAAALSSGAVLYPAAYDENGRRVIDHTLSGMNGNGGASAGANCKDWTDSTLMAVHGHTHASGPGWPYNNAGVAPCGMAFRMLCVMKGANTRVTVTPVAGKKLYATKSAWVPGAGLSAADAKCLADAPASVTAAKAVLVASARALTDVLGEATIYVRPDGVRVGTGAEVIQALNTSTAPASIESGATQDGDGNFVNSLTWTGISYQGTADKDTCRDWTSTASTDTGTGGYPSSGWSCAGKCGSFACGNPAGLLLECAEQ
jgi:hypothetical protein